MIDLTKIADKVIAEFEAMSVEEFADRLRAKGVDVEISDDFAKRLLDVADANCFTSEPCKVTPVFGKFQSTQGNSIQQDI